MDRKYWEEIAPNYNEEIFDVLHNDKSGVIVSAIKELSSPEKTAIDIGCAIGKWIPLLASSFKKVMAVDISATNLEIAQQNCNEFDNVEYVRADVSDRRFSILPCDVVICINAILTSSLPKRNNFFNSLKKSVSKTGTLLLVVPSLESAMYSGILRHRWKIDRDIQKRSITREPVKKLKNLRQGNIEIDGVPTKHYLEEELQLLLTHEGFREINTQKVEYKWSTEFVNPPEWLKEPFPWDWMCIARKKSK